MGSQGLGHSELDPCYANAYYYRAEAYATKGDYNLKSGGSPGQAAVLKEVGENQFGLHRTPS